MHQDMIEPQRFAEIIDADRLVPERRCSQQARCAADVIRRVQKLI